MQDTSSTEPQSYLEHFWYRRRREWVLLKRYGPGQVQFWFIALLLGVVAGLATVAFRIAISAMQEFFYGADDVTLASHAATLAWWKVLLLPVVGGLIVGFLLWRYSPSGRVHSVSHVIEGCAMRDGRVERNAGRISILASLVTLSTGGSTGREGPVVHMAASLSSMVSNFLRANGVTARDLMGCATASAVAASFNAPIAGTIFALEVILRHFAVHSFAPIAIAAVAGAVVGRMTFGEAVEFDLIGTTKLDFYVELPAFMILGLVCGLVAVVMMKSIFAAEDVADQLQSRFEIPLWLRPALAGLMLGVIALWFPHIIGVGYETTYNALQGDLTLAAAIGIAIAKVVAVAITVGGRMGGGVFSPALMLGALTGLAFGILATSLFPGWSGLENVYAVAGMAAVAAAVLGAPISTTLIAFELTGDWQIGIAVLVAVSLATILSSRMVKKSFFLAQLERRGIHLADGPQVYTLSTISVSTIMRPMDELSGKRRKRFKLALEAGNFINVDTTLETALPQLENGGHKSLPVVAMAEGEPVLLGALYYTDALKAYSRALAEVAREEHS